MWPDRSGKEDSKTALEQARAKLLETRRRGPEVAEVALALRTLREENHFSEQLSKIMGGE